MGVLYARVGGAWVPVSNQGPAGPAGATGPAGPQGPTGPAGIVFSTVHQSTDVTMTAAGQYDIAQVTIPPIAIATVVVVLLSVGVGNGSGAWDCSWTSDMVRVSNQAVPIAGHSGNMTTPPGNWLWRTDAARFTLPANTSEGVKVRCRLNVNHIGSYGHANTTIMQYAG